MERNPKDPYAPTWRDVFLFSVTVAIVGGAVVGAALIGYLTLMNAVIIFLVGG